MQLHFEREPICVNIVKLKHIKMSSCRTKVDYLFFLFRFMQCILIKKILFLFSLTNVNCQLWIDKQRKHKKSKNKTGRDWKWRPPPRGYTADSYTLCETFMENSTCHYGNQCVEAHGEEELHEWKDRFEYRKMRLQRACEKELFGKSFTEQLLEKWVSYITVRRSTCNPSITGIFFLLFS